MFMICCLASWFYGRAATNFRISRIVVSKKLPNSSLVPLEREGALVNRFLVDERDRFQMRPLVVITPARIYMDVLRTYRGSSCVVRPNVELNDRKLSQKELVYAHRYVAQEGWSEYANGLWEPDPELTRFMEESLGA
jgi:hypothetical protein